MTTFLKCFQKFFIYIWHILNFFSSVFSLVWSSSMMMSKITILVALFFFQFKPTVTCAANKYHQNKNNKIVKHKCCTHTSGIAYEESQFSNGRYDWNWPYFICKGQRKGTLNTYAIQQHVGQQQ